MYSDFNVDGKKITMSERECETGIKFLIGDRFFYEVSTFNADMAFDFFNNFASLVSYGDLKKAWDCYVKATSQRLDNKWSAFWHYYDGHKIKQTSRKWQSFKWVA